MREETRRRLERTLWTRRLKWIAVGLAIIAAMAGLFLLEGLDATVENRSAHGVVTHVEPLNTLNRKAVAQGLSVDVKLDDGRRIQVLASKATDPHVGQEVRIAEHHHGTGRVTYSWK